ncbi:protein kinase [Actinoplanes sp. NPDC049668]|uniref:serine/threonine-protein kinase n=1 Tax=unclassified Actinoplanes TaxID=2626549 RepID=UPI0033BDFEA2
MAVRRMLIAGRYRLLEPVGSGGMGRVWLARDEMLDRDVAVKEFVPPNWMTDEEKARLRDRTLREARSAARLNHPHVIRIYDVVHARDLPWIVMEYVQSRSLYQVLGEDGPFPPAEAARIGLDVLEAITAAHRAGVLHRDVKPHNVLIGHDGRVVLTDFGLATFVDDGSVTGPGLVVGSPQYVSPERARDGASTVESDLWSFGATLYAAVEGRSPFARDNAMATLMALATEEPDPPRLAGPLAPVLTGLLRREPVERLTAREAEMLLRVVVAQDAVVLAAQPTSGRVAVPSPRRPPDDQPARPSALALPGPAAEPEAAHIPAQRGGPPRTREKPRRRLALAGLVALVMLAAGGVAAALALRGDPETGLAGGVAPSVATTSGAGGGAGGFSPVNCESPVSADLPTTPLPGAAKLRGGWALYDGWSYFTDPSGFHIAVPDGWTYETIGTTICFRDPGSVRMLSVDPARSPQGDPVQACRKEAGRLRAAGDLPGYRQLRIDRVPGLARAADWEYTYDGRAGGRMHAMTRWRAANDGKAYAIGLMTRELDWPGNFEKWGMIQSTFYTDG